MVLSIIALGWPFLDFTRSLEEETVDMRGVKITLLEVEDPLVPYPGRFGEGEAYSPAPDGCRFVGARIREENIQLPQSSFLLVDTQGTLFGPIQWDLLPSQGADMTKGASRQGWIIFVIPEEVEIVSVRFDPTARWALTWAPYRGDTPCYSGK